MTEQERLEKNRKIRETRKTTAARRATQTCTVYKIKIDYSRLTERQKEVLKMLFVEAKWMYNDILSFSREHDIREYKPLKKSVLVKTKNGDFEEREFKYIGSQMKQSVYTEILTTIKALATLKKKNRQKPGVLKFTQNYTSLNLKKYENCYKFYTVNKMKISCIPGKVYVSGTKQFINDPTVEFANAKILNTPLGYYVAITVYRPKEKNIRKEHLPEIGIDMGIETSITTSAGEKISVMIGETERLKRLSRKMNRQQKGSNNRHKTLKLLQKEYQKLSNRKDDMANKLVARLLEHETVYMQDENISGWHKGLFGKQVQHSIMGRVKAKLVNHSRVIVLNRWVPTTKYCQACKVKHPSIKLEDRTFRCPYCGYTEDRDVHAARNMIVMAKEGYPLKDSKDKVANKKLAALNRQVPVGCREFTPVEIDASTSTKVLSEMIVEARSVEEAGRLDYK